MINLRSWTVVILALALTPSLGLRTIVSAAPPVVGDKVYGSPDKSFESVGSATFNDTRYHLGAKPGDGWAISNSFDTEPIHWKYVPSRVTIKRDLGKLVEHEDEKAAKRANDLPNITAFSGVGCTGQQTAAVQTRANECYEVGQTPRFSFTLSHELTHLPYWECAVYGSAYAPDCETGCSNYGWEDNLLDYSGCFDPTGNICAWLMFLSPESATAA